MDQLASQINALVEFPIDFEGQKKVDSLIFYTVHAAIPVSVAVGFLTQDLVKLLLAFAACILVTFALVLPAWPSYNQNPVLWLQVKYDL